MDFSETQAEKKASIEKTAMIWGVVVAVIVGLIALWALSSQGAAIRFGGAAIVALGAGLLTRNASFNSGAKSAKCAACGAAFSRSRTDRSEVLASSAPKEERKDQDDGTIEVTTWTEETYDVTDTYTCSKCSDTTMNTYQTTRRKDVETTTEQRKKSAAPAEIQPEPDTSAPADPPPATSAGDAGGAPKKKSSASAATPKKKTSGGGRKSAS